MLFLILFNLFVLPFQIDQVNYYYFTDPTCIPCQVQLPIIIALQEEGFDFEIINDPELIKNFKVYAFPTIVIELTDYRRREVREIRLISFQSYGELKRIILRNKVGNRG